MFIAFEGIDGAGKSTHLALLKGELERRGYNVIALKEPGSLTNKVIQSDWIDSWTIFLAIMTDRKRNNHIIRECLEDENTIILSDRYILTTFVYQVDGMGEDEDLIRLINEKVVRGLECDHYIYIDIPGSVSVKRISGDDFFERRPAEWFEKLRVSYWKRLNPARDIFIPYEQERSIEETHNLIVSKLINRRII